MKLLIVLAAVLLVGLAACGKPTFRVTQPQDWVPVLTTTDEATYTRDGILLQLIKVQTIPLTKDLPHTKKTLKKDMLPHEAAEVIADNFLNDPEFGHQRVIENSPTTIANQKGFFLHVSYQTKAGLTKQAQYCGTIVGEKLTLLLYEAPSRYYFDASLPAFMQVRQSFEFLSEK